MFSLLPANEIIGAMLKAQGQTVAVSESSSGGLVSAALLAVPGASAYFMGGAVVYTRAARGALMGITDEDMAGMRSSSELYAQLLARRLHERFGTHWGIAETGAAGPRGNSYGDAAGHSCLAIHGPVCLSRTIETGSTDRVANMHVFAAALLGLFREALDKVP